jgi:hypothetical protein
LMSINNRGLMLAGCRHESASSTDIKPASEAIMATVVRSVRDSHEPSH